MTQEQSYRKIRPLELEVGLTVQHYRYDRLWKIIDIQKVGGRIRRLGTVTIESHPHTGVDDVPVSKTLQIASLCRDYWIVSIQ